MLDNKIPIISPYYEVSPVSNLMWNLEMINVSSFWEKTKGGGRVVAIIDTGLDTNHPEFKGRIIEPCNFTNPANVYDVKDISGHGTHIAGTIGGNTTGVAPECRIMPLKVFPDDSKDTNVGLYIQDAFIFIKQWNKRCKPEDKVVAVNCSFGGRVYDFITAYCIRELASDGVAVCVAAGNSGDGDPETHEVFSFPAFIDEVITVSSVNQNGSIANYSNSFDGIDISAPGTYIYSTWPGNTYNTISGTSMATPHITGACALLIDWFYKREGRMPIEGEIDAAMPKFKQAEGVLFKHIKPVLNGNSYLFGRGILDLSFKYDRWPLHRIQTGAFYYKDGAITRKKEVESKGIPVYQVKY